MKYTYEHRDLFSVDPDYILAHCISSDFVMGAGIAKLFTNRGIKERLHNTYPLNSWNNHGYMLPIFTKNHIVANLVTKHFVYEKPTYNTLTDSLIDLRDWTIRAYYSGRIPSLKIAMPLIGCGLDLLEWDKVEPIIKDVFKDTDIDILVCEWP